MNPTTYSSVKGLSVKGGHKKVLVHIQEEAYDEDTSNLPSKKPSPLKAEGSPSLIKPSKKLDEIELARRIKN